MSCRTFSLWFAAGLALVAAVAAQPAVAASAASVDSFRWDAQAMPESVGSPIDARAREASMATLQENLASRQVAAAADREVVVRLSQSERRLIDEPGRVTGKYMVGISRKLDTAIDFSAASALAARKTADLAIGTARGLGDGGFEWTASVSVPGATALRAHLTGVDLPAGAEMYVYNRAGQAFGPYTGRGPLGSGDLYTNTVFGNRLLLQVNVPAGAGSVPPMRFAEVGVMGQRFAAPRYSVRGENSDVDSIVAAAGFCSYNASCVTNAGCGGTNSAVNTAKQAVAGMLFQSGGGWYICTGGLVADTVSTSVIPYFLTAHHCISSSGEASSLETFFDYTTTCSNPDCSQSVYDNTGDTVGATILASSSNSDFTLLRLSSTPVTKDGIANYLGWLSTAVANTNNYALYRISHPQGSPQAYSEQVVDTTKGTCRTLSRGNFIYSRDTLGATEGGSSGSPVVNSAGQIVGQLYGACGTNLNDVCDSAHNATVDGAFAVTYPSVAQWLSPGGGSCSPKGASCTSGSSCCSGQCKGKPGAKTCG